MLSRVGTWSAGMQRCLLMSAWSVGETRIQVILTQASGGGCNDNAPTPGKERACREGERCAERTRPSFLGRSEENQGSDSGLDFDR